MTDISNGKVYNGRFIIVKWGYGPRGYVAYAIYDNFEGDYLMDKLDNLTNRRSIRMFQSILEAEEFLDAVTKENKCRNAKNHTRYYERNPKSLYLLEDYYDET